MQRLKNIYKFAVTIYFKFNEHNGFLLAAGIAFFTFLSLFPILILVGIALGYFLESPALREQIIAYVFKSLPSLTDTIRTTIEQAVQDTINKLIAHRPSAGVIALIGLIWSATGLFGGLGVALNAVYEVKETRNIIIQRLIALGVFLLIMLLLLISFGATSVASVFRDQVLNLFFPRQVVTFAWTFLSYAIGFISTLLLFLTVYRFVPNVKLKFKDVWLGTLVAGFASEVGKYGFAVYIHMFASKSYGVVYGSLATIVLLMFWLNISAMLLLIGAEINVAYRKQKMGGVKIFEPRKSSQSHI